MRSICRWCSGRRGLVIEFCFFKATPGVVLGGTWALTPPPDPLPSPAQRERGEGRGNWGDFAAGGLAARRKIPSSSPLPRVKRWGGG
jgi:hypothetical protein